MNILLAFPRFPRDTFWSFDRPLALSGRRSTMPPLGLLTVAALFPTGRFHFTLADANVHPIADDAIADADIVLISAMLAQLDSLEELLARCRQLGTRVMVGGPLISGCFRELLQRGIDPDCWFIGEAERLMPEVIRDLEAGQLRRVYAHVPDEVRAAQVRDSFGAQAHILVEALPDLASSPVPRFDLVTMRHYHSMAIQASRGCPIGCEFCDIWKQFGLKSRTGDADRLITQLNYLHTLGWRGRVFIVDDNFIGNIKSARTLLQALEDWQRSPKSFRIPTAFDGIISGARLRRMRRAFRSRVYPFAFSTESDVRLGDPAPKMTALRIGMQRAGFNSVFLGIESPSTEALREAGKQVNIGKDGQAGASLLERVRNIQETGIVVMAGFIVGFDDDPHDIDQGMIEFIEQAGIPMAMVGLLGVIPGTALQERLEREGRYRARLVGSQTHEFALNFRPKNRSENSVLDKYAHVLRVVYGNRMKSYYQRCERMMERMPAPAPTGDRIGWRELRAFALSLVSTRPLLSYWSFLLRTLLRRPRFIGQAVVLALQGEHLHRLTVAKLAQYDTRRTHRSARANQALTSTAIHAAPPAA